MTVKAHTFYTLECDDCDVPLSDETESWEWDGSAAKELAHEHDWREQDGNDFCTGCSRKRGLFDGGTLG